MSTWPSALRFRPAAELDVDDDVEFGAAASARRRCLRGALSAELAFVFVGECERPERPERDEASSPAPAQGRFRALLLLGCDEEATDALDGERAMPGEAAGAGGRGEPSSAVSRAGAVLGARGAVASFGLAGGSRISGAIAFFGTRAAGATPVSAQVAVGSAAEGGGGGVSN